MTGKKQSRKKAGTKRARSKASPTPAARDEAPASEDLTPQGMAVSAGGRGPTSETETAMPARARAGAEGGSTRSHVERDCRLVAIGASAGGLDAFKRFLAAMPGDSGFAFVLVPHLDPRRESMMVELLAKQTRMPVLEAEHGARIEPDHVYVIPPNRYLGIDDGRVKLSRLPETHGAETVIDFTLSSVAHSHGEAAIGVILSGTGSHGVLGLKEIKLAGGIVLVQEPATAEYDSMPRNAIATGLVDQVLAPEGIAEALGRYARHAPQSPHEPAAEPERDGLRRILSLLQARTGQDFRHYRKKMTVRRIERRMVLKRIESWDDYIEYLRGDADEVQGLARDLLITVTAFFRNADAFEALARDVLPELVERAESGAPVRVWVPGCASGEEAYSIAMLLLEQFRAADKAPNMQIFATDVDEGSLEIGRRGVYAESIAAAVSPERLKRFFTKSGDHHFQATKQLRDSIVFARQNLITDAPFSKLDLISCRNVLIYLESEVQQKIISLLHFALKDDGYLLLGPSESIGRASDMFSPVSKKWRLFRRVGLTRRDRVSIPIVSGEPRAPQAALREAVRQPQASFSVLMQRLLAEDFAPASALVNGDYEILAVQGPLVNFLSFPPGEMTKDLLALARPGLRARIRAACQRATGERRTVTDPDARVRRNGGYVACSIRVRPVTEGGEGEGLLLVVFEDRPDAPPRLETSEPEPGRDDGLVEQLENELRTTREELSSTIEELETSNEELKASNEEIMSMNEELQSTNEELETSKEELQSLNEELATVNSQLQEKVEELDEANSDLVNLIAATNVPTVFLDIELRIQRFTPPMTKLLNLVPTDVGRPFSDFAPRFEDTQLLDDTRSVLDTLMQSEHEVHTDDGRWYLRRILPYRIGGKRVGGVVITFFDITERMAAEAQARRLATVLLESNDAVTICDFDGRIRSWNGGAAELYGYSESSALRMTLFDLMPEQLREETRALLERVARGDEVASFQTKRIARDGRVLDAWITMTPLRDESGGVVSVATTERDITARRQAEEAVHELNASLEQRVAAQTAELEASAQRIRSVLDAALDAIVTIDAAGTIETFNTAAEHMFGYSADEAIGENVSLLMGSPYAEYHDEYLRRYRETGERRVIGRTREFTALQKDGTEFPIQLSVNEVAGEEAYIGILRDLSEQKALQQEIVRIATLEQQRIGEELHDSTQQELTGLGLLAQNLREKLEARGAGPETELAAKLAAGIADANRQLRSLSRGLVPVAVDAEGLMVALEDLAKGVEAQHEDIKCRFECPARVELADDVVAVHLYRIAQEACTNALRHSGGDEITLRLEREGHELVLEVADNGKGIEPAAGDAEGLGMRIMAHRCSLIGGTLDVGGAEAGGTFVTCRLSMPAVP